MLRWYKGAQSVPKKWVLVNKVKLFHVKVVNELLREILFLGAFFFFFFTVDLFYIINISAYLWTGPSLPVWSHSKSRPRGRKLTGISTKIIVSFKLWLSFSKQQILINTGLLIPYSHNFSFEKNHYLLHRRCHSFFNFCIWLTCFSLSLNTVVL